MKSRRNFIQKSTAIGLGSGLISSIPNFLIAKDLKKNSPNETINFGVIGCKGQGWSNMRSILKNKNIRSVEKIYLMTTNSSEFYKQLGFNINKKQSLMVIQISGII